MKSVTKSKFLAFFAVIALFSAVIFAGGCDGSSSSSNNEEEHYSEEELAMQEWDKQQAELPDDTVEKKMMTTGQSIIDDLDLEESEEETPENSGGALLLNAANNSAPLLGVADNGGSQSNGREIIAEGRIMLGETAYMDYESYYTYVTEDESKYPVFDDHDPKTTKTYKLIVTKISSANVPENFLERYNNGEFKLANGKFTDFNDTDILIADSFDIGKNAFKGLNKLQMVIVRGRYADFGESAFENCSKLWYVGYFFKPNSETLKIVLGKRAFANCATNSPETDNTLYFDCGIMAEPSDEDCAAPFEGTKKNIGVSQIRTLAGLSPIDRINKEIRLIRHGKVVKPWGCDLSDNALICNLSIPGSHDSATHNCENVGPGYARTQSFSLSGQWKQGVRFFDLRVVHADKNGDYGRYQVERARTIPGGPQPVKPADRSYMEIAHGIYTCYRLDSSGKKIALTLHDAIKEIADEVYQSGDFAIIQITHQNEGDDVCGIFETEGDDYNLGDRAIQEELAKWKKTEGDYKNVAADYNKKDLRVKDLRGKILFIHNRPNLVGCPRDYIPVTGCWGHGLEVESKLKDLVKFKGIGNDDNYEQNGNKVLMQNLAHANPEEKLKAVQYMFTEYAKAYCRPYTWGFNYTSGYRQNFWKDAMIPNYQVVAEGVNGQVADIINNMSAGTPIGFTIMDFAGVEWATRPAVSGSYHVNGDKLLDAVIKHNFK